MYMLYMMFVLNAYTLIIDYDWCDAYSQWFTAYLFVLMGRRNAGLVCMVSVWIAGAISAFILES